MFGLGFAEIAIIVVVLFIAVRPEDLPKLFWKLGRAYREIQEFRRAAHGMMRKVEREVQESNARKNRQGEEKQS